MVYCREGMDVRRRGWGEVEGRRCILCLMEGRPCMNMDGFGMMEGILLYGLYD